MYSRIFCLMLGKRIQEFVVCALLQGHHVPRNICESSRTLVHNSVVDVPDMIGKDSRVHYKGFGAVLLKFFFSLTNSTLKTFKMFFLN